MKKALLALASFALAAGVANAQCSMLALPPYLQACSSSNSALYIPSDNMSVATLPPAVSSGSWGSSWSWAFGSSNSNGNLYLSAGTNGDTFLVDYNGTSSGEGIYVHSATTSVEAVFRPAVYQNSIAGPGFGIVLYDQANNLLYIVYPYENSSGAWTVVFGSYSASSTSSSIVWSTSGPPNSYATTSISGETYHLKLLTALGGDNHYHPIASYTLDGGGSSTWLWGPALTNTPNFTYAGIVMAPESLTNLYSLVVN